MSTETSSAKWFKSSRSRDGGECVEVAHLTNGAVGVRDSKPHRPSASLHPPVNGTPSPPAFRTASSSDRRSSTEFEQPLTEYGTGQPVTRSWIAFDH